LGIRSLRQPHQWAAVVFAVIGLAGAIFMMLPLSHGVWKQFPLLAFVQHPTRLLAPAAFMLAILAGLAVMAAPERWRVGVTLVGIVLIFLTAVPLLYPRYREPFPAAPTLLDMMAHEHASGAIGTTSFGEYLPIWVKQAPPDSPLEPMYQTGAAIERLDLTYLPPGSKLVSASYGFNRAELIIDSPEPYQAIFHTFYFPGWTAWVDGQPGQIAPVSERGLIGVLMPAGRHQLELYFHETPFRRMANAISVVSLAVLLTLLVISLRHFKSGAVPWPNGLTARQFIILGGVGFVLIVAKVVYLDRFDNPLKHTFDGISIAGVDVSKQVNFGHQVNLLGYDLDRQIVTAGQSFNLTAYWQARQSLNINYSSLAQVVDAEHRLYAAQDNLHPGELPVTRWSPWGFVQDRHKVRVPPGTPPGDYFLVTGLYDPSTWVRLPVLEGGDSGWADVIAIPVTVAKSAQSPIMAELDIRWPTEIKFGSELMLLGATPERDLILRNDFLRIALFWEALSDPTVDYQIRLQLVTGDGTVALTQTGQPSYNRYPTTRWAAGERVRDNHAFWISPDFSAGAYRIQVQVLDDAGQPLDQWAELGELETAK
jgi:hypothetical protein